MKRRWLLSLSIAAPVLHIHAVTARMEFTEEEREILEWSRGENPGFLIAEPLERTRLADEGLQRSFSVVRCSRTWQRPTRWTNASYNGVLRETVRLLEQIVSDDRLVQGSLESDWQATLIYTYRSWNRSKQLGWLRYMRSPDTRRGFEWWGKTRTLQDLANLSADANTGSTIPVWANWAGEFLATAELSASFRQAANALQPRLGDEFMAQASWPVDGDPAGDQVRARIHLMERLLPRWGDILTAMERAADPQTVQAGHEWSSHPAVDDIRANHNLILEASFNRVTEQTPVTAFLAEAGRGRPRTERIRNAFATALNLNAQRNCATLH